MSLTTKAKAILGAATSRLIRKTGPAGADDASASVLKPLVVWAIPPNRHLLICHSLGADGGDPMTLVNVQVRDNRNFLKKMPLQARYVSGRSYIFEGPMPRWKGRW